MFKTTYLSPVGKLVLLSDGERLSGVLAEKQVSAKELCVAVGKNETTVSRWCNNKIQPSVAQLQEIARFLDVDVRELLCPTK